MKKSVVIRIILIVSIAILSTSLVTNYISQFDDEIEIIVLKEDIEARTVIDAEDIRIIKIGEKEKRTFFNNAEKSTEQIIGKITTDKLSSNYVFVKDDPHLVAAQENKTIVNDKINDPYFIDNNHRVAQVTLSQSNALSGKLKKGDFVDVVYTAKSNSDAFTSLILQHVFVYDIDEDSDEVNVYFKMKIEDCMKLVFAKETGEISLILNPLVGQTEDVKSVTHQSLYNNRGEE